MILVIAAGAACCWCCWLGCCWCCCQASALLLLSRNLRYYYLWYLISNSAPQDERDKAVGGLLRPLQGAEGMDNGRLRRGAGCLLSSLFSVFSLGRAFCLPSFFLQMEVFAIMFHSVQVSSCKIPVAVARSQGLKTTARKDKREKYQVGTTLFQIQASKWGGWVVRVSLIA